MGFYNDRWHYSHADIDVGDLISATKSYRRLVLRRRRQTVDRENAVLWHRSKYTSDDLTDSFGETFKFKIIRNPVMGVHYRELTGYVLERTWYRLDRTPAGGLHARRDPDTELVAVVLGGRPVYRLDVQNPTVTTRMREVFPEAFERDIAELGDLIP